MREIRRKTRRRYSCEENIRIVLKALRDEESVPGLCNREGISPNLYYNWSKEFLEAARRRLQGDTKREATRSAFLKKSARATAPMAQRRGIGIS